MVLKLETGCYDIHRIEISRLSLFLMKYKQVLLQIYFAYNSSVNSLPHAMQNFTLDFIYAYLWNDSGFTVYSAPSCSDEHFFTESVNLMSCFVLSLCNNFHHSLTVVCIYYMHDDGNTEEQSFAPNHVFHLKRTKLLT